MKAQTKFNDQKVKVTFPDGKNEYIITISELQERIIKVTSKCNNWFFDKLLKYGKSYNSGFGWYEIIEK